MDWFYEQNGQQAGPVSRGEILRLVVQRRILPHTLVWTPAFGDQWRPASKAGLLAPIAGASAVPVPPLTPEIAAAAKRVPSVWAWILVIVPSLLDISLQIATYIRGTRMGGDASLIAVVLLYAILFLSLVQDRRALADSGFAPPSFWWWLFIPGYFWVRAKRLGGRGRTLFVVSLAMLVLRLFVFFYQPPPDVVGTEISGWSVYLHAPSSRPAPERSPPQRPGPDVSGRGASEPDASEKKNAQENKQAPQQASPQQAPLQQDDSSAASSEPRDEDNLHI